MARWTLVLGASLLSLRTLVNTQPLVLTAPLCLNDADLADSLDLFDVTSVYAQVQNESLRLVVAGQVGRESDGYSSSTGLLSTVIIDGGILNMNSYSNRSSLCSQMSDGCPYGPDAIAFGVDIPFSNPPRLADYDTRINVLDDSSPSQQLTCLQLSVTPYVPHAIEYRLFRWFPIAIAVALLLLQIVARLLAVRHLRLADTDTMIAADLRRPSDSTSSFRALFFDAFAGIPLLRSPALVHFASPAAIDPVIAVQRVTALAMIPLSWPGFAYTILSYPLSWSCLIGSPPSFFSNYSSISPFHQNLSTGLDPFQTSLASQYTNVSSSVFLDESLPNTLLLDLNTTDPGMPRWAKIAGINSPHLFSMSIAIFLILVAAIIIVSIAIFFFDLFALFIVNSRHAGLSATENSNAKHEYDTVKWPQGRPSTAGYSEEEEDDDDDDDSDDDDEDDDYDYEENGNQRRRKSRSALLSNIFAAPKSRKKNRRRTRKNDRHSSKQSNWWPLIKSLVLVHACLTASNLIRLLRLFHFPLVIFATYELTLDNRSTSLAAEAVFALIIFGVIVPGILVWRLSVTPRDQLWIDDSRPPTLTCLVLSPLYSSYTYKTATATVALTFSHSLITGIVVGAAQSIPTLQAALLLAFEVVNSLVITVWLPWYRKAPMGAHSFSQAVLRLLTSLLVLVLAPDLKIGYVAAGWVTYVLLGFQAISLLLFLLATLNRFLELAVRICFHAPFDESTNSRSFGFVGAMKRRTRRRTRPSQSRKSTLSPINTDRGSVTMTATSRGAKKSIASSEALNKKHKGHRFNGSNGRSSVGSYSDLLSISSPVSSVSGVPPYSSHRPQSSFGTYHNNSHSRNHTSSGMSRNTKNEDPNDGYIMSAWNYPTHPNQQPQPSQHSERMPYPPRFGSGHHHPPPSLQQLPLSVDPSVASTPGSSSLPSPTTVAPSVSMSAKSNANAEQSEKEVVQPQPPLPASSKKDGGSSGEPGNKKENKKAGFSVVRGGKATGKSPYSILSSARPGRSKDIQYQPPPSQQPSPQPPSSNSSHNTKNRIRPKSQSAIVEADFASSMARERLGSTPSTLPTDSEFARNEDSSTGGDFELIEKQPESSKNSGAAGGNATAPSSNWLPTWLGGGGSGNGEPVSKKRHRHESNDVGMNRDEPSKKGRKGKAIRNKPKTPPGEKSEAEEAAPPSSSFVVTRKPRQRPAPPRAMSDVKSDTTEEILPANHSTRSNPSIVAAASNSKAPSSRPSLPPGARSSENVPDDETQSKRSYQLPAGARLEKLEEDSKRGSVAQSHSRSGSEISNQPPKLPDLNF